MRPPASFLAGPFHMRQTGTSAVRRTTIPSLIPPSPGGLTAEARSARASSGSPLGTTTAFPWSCAGQGERARGRRRGGADAEGAVGAVGGTAAAAMSVGAARGAGATVAMGAGVCDSRVAPARRPPRRMTAPDQEILFVDSLLTKNDRGYRAEHQRRRPVLGDARPHRVRSCSGTPRPRSSPRCHPSRRGRRRGGRCRARRRRAPPRAPRAPRPRS